MWQSHLVYRHWVNEEGIPDMAPGRRSVMEMMNLETGEVTRLHTFDSCGHIAQMEHAEAFNDLALEFLAG